MIEIIVCLKQTEQNIVFVVDVTAASQTADDTTEDDDNGGGWTVMTKSVISLTGLGICIVLAGLTAKLVDKCHDRISLRDDASDMSEHTRELLKARYATALFAFTANRYGGNDHNARARAFGAAKKFGRVWLVRARMARRERQKNSEKEDLENNEDTEQPQNDAEQETTKVTPYKPTEETISEISESTDKVSNMILNKKDTTSTKLKDKQEAAFVSIDIEPSKDAKNNVDSVNENKRDRKQSTSYIGYRDVSDDVTIPVRVSSDEMPRPKELANESTPAGDDFSSGSSLADLVAQLPQTPGPPKPSNAWASRENTVVSMNTSPDSKPGHDFNRNETSESIQLNNKSETPTKDTEQNKSKQDGKPTPRPLTSRSSGMLTPGARNLKSAKRK